MSRPPRSTAGSIASPAASTAPAVRATARSVACPRCGKSVVWSTENRFRPFCSQRCRTIDLGGWASEAYRVPETVQPLDESGDC